MDFVFSEFGSVDLGDERLNRRLRGQLENMLKSPSGSVQSACSGWAETNAAYRLFNNGKVTMEKILAPHRRGLLDRAGEHACIALIQDTTELDYSGHRAMDARGPLNCERRRGFFLHSQYAVSETRVPLGLWATQLWAREKLNGAYKASLPIEEKESYRWVEGMRHAHELAQALPQTKVFSVADREGDIYEVIQECADLRRQTDGSAHLLVRANLDRSVDSLLRPGDTEADAGAQGRLFELTGRARAGLRGVCHPFAPGDEKSQRAEPALPPQGPPGAPRDQGLRNHAVQAGATPQRPRAQTPPHVDGSGPGDR